MKLPDFLYLKELDGFHIPTWSIKAMTNEKERLTHCHDIGSPLEEIYGDLEEFTTSLFHYCECRVICEAKTFSQERTESLMATS